MRCTISCLNVFFPSGMWLGWLITCLFLAGGPATAIADDGPLAVSIHSQVDDTGNVRLALELKNVSPRPLYHIHPMFHFHHNMSMMPHIMRLEPGEIRVLENNQHPPVLREGRYPLVAMVKFKESPDQAVPFTQIHTDAFTFRETVTSAVEGTLQTTAAQNDSKVKVTLTNHSEGLKNVRLMMLLPPGLLAEGFNGMMGFTLRGGEQKEFEVPVRRVSETHVDSFPVYLMVEYGEMLKHYTGEIKGRINFGPVWSFDQMGPHLLGIVFLGLGFFMVYWTRFRKPATV